MTALTIQGYKFDVPDSVIASIAIGYTLQEEGEVHALRQTKLENLRNNFASKVRNAMPKNGDGEATDIPADALASLQAEFTAYANTYRFGLRSTTTRQPRMDPLTKEMFNLAKSDYTAAYIAKFDEKPDRDLVAEMAEELMEKRGDDLRKRAEAILKQRTAPKIDAATLEALGL